jgi:peptidyl-prolyl cis-trans isomerase C
MMAQKLLAAQAVERKLEQIPENATRLRLERERVLAQLRVAEVEEAAIAEFDAKRSQYEARARELYLSDRKKYETPEQVMASHILFDIHKHTREEALKLAEDARAKIVAGADFNEVAQKSSEDPSAGTNAGKLGWFAKTEMDPAFGNAAFALRNVGEVSQPVLSNFGWHLIKLEGKRPASVKPFDSVKDLILADMRQKFVEEQRDAVLRVVNDDSGRKVNTQAIDALYLAPETEKAKRAIEAGKNTSAQTSQDAPTQQAK